MQNERLMYRANFDEIGVVGKKTDQSRLETDNPFNKINRDPGKLIKSDSLLLVFQITVN